MRIIESSGNASIVASDVDTPQPGSSGQDIAIYYEGRYIPIYFWAPDGVGQVPVKESWLGERQHPVAAEVRPGDGSVTVVFDSDTTNNYIQIVKFSLETGKEVSRYNFTTSKFESPNPTNGVNYLPSYDPSTGVYTAHNFMCLHGSGIPDEPSGSMPPNLNARYKKALVQFSDVLNPSQSGTTSNNIYSLGSGVESVTGVAKQKDTFQFSATPGFGDQKDSITNFSTKDKDVLQFSKSAFGVSVGKFAIAKTQKKLNKVLASDVDIVYNQPKGELIFNANGPEAGFGVDGGVFAQLLGAPKLTAAAVSFI